MKKRTVAFHTLGCKLNYAETSTLGRQLAGAGFQPVDFDASADVYVINTCSVTENADRECRRIVHRALRANPSAFIAVTGCFAQLKPAEVAGIEGVDLVLGASEKFRMAEFLGDLAKKELAAIHSCDISQAGTFTSAYSAGDRTRAFLKVQDGCDYTCSYCTIPMARGTSRSDSIDNICRQAQKIASRGIKEIVLTGVNIGDFRDPSLKTSEGRSNHLLRLLLRLDEIDGIARYRISSIEPNLLTDEIIRFVSASRKFAPHFHIPLQSGSDTVLKRMRRRYLSETYAGRVSMIRTLMPNASIGADVIVGFPGESESEFLETCTFLRDIDVSYLHVFTYSERDNTDAIRYAGVVPVAERKRRNHVLRNLSDKKHRAFGSRMAGSLSTVLFESDHRDGTLHGYTPHYLKVRVPYDSSLVNCLADVQLLEMDADGTYSCKLDSQQAEGVLSAETADALLS